MSFFGGSTAKVPYEDPEPLGVDPNLVATNEAARPVPYVSGTRWVGVTWLEDAFDVWTTAITSKVGKKTQVTGYNYYCSFAALLCLGPIDVLWGIKWDDKKVWDGPVHRGDSDYIDITIAGIGHFRIYWGTDTQVMDPNLAGSGLNHAPYRGLAYLVGIDVLLGQDRTTVPNIEVRVARFPAPEWLPEAQRVIEGSCANPVAVVWDWWTSPRYGLGRGAHELDEDRLAAAGARLYQELVGVSVLLTSEDDFRTLLVKLMEHVDGYVTTFNGRLGVELSRGEELGEPVAWLERKDLIGDPDITADGWPETYDEVRVRYKDQFLENQDNVAKHHDLANYALTGRHRTLNVDRPWTVRGSMAAAQAAVLGRVMGVPGFKGSMKVRASRSRALQLGAVFVLRTRAGEELVAKVMERTEENPGDASVSISFQFDTGWAVADYYTVFTGERTVHTYGPATPDAARTLDCPYAFALEDIHTLLYAVARGDTWDTAFDAWRANEPGGPYTAASDHRSNVPFTKFATRARLTAAYPAGTAVVDEWVGVEFDFDVSDDSVLTGEWDLADALEHKLLLLALDPSTPDRIAEVMSLFDVVKVGPASYTAKCVRGLYDTRRTAHAEGAEVWVQLRASLQPDTWAPISEVPRWYKFQTVFGAQELDFDQALQVQHLDDGRCLRPIVPANLRANGDSTGATWEVGSDVVISWDNTSRAATVYGLDLSAAPPTDLDAVVIQFWSDDLSTLLAELEADPAPEAYVASDLFLTTNVNQDFRVRVYGRRGQWTSLLSNELAVQMITP